MIAFGVALVIVVYLMAAFYREAIVPTMAGQVHQAARTGILADMQRR